MVDVVGPVVAVGEARTPLPTPDLDDPGLKPATQTKAIGIIYPPPDIRAIVDKTAQFVARNGTFPLLFADLHAVSTAETPMYGMLLDPQLVSKFVSDS